MTLQDLNNPKEINGILYWRKDKCIEVELGDGQAFQEWPGSVELWEIDNGLLRRVQRWLKKSVSHYKIKGTFVLASDTINNNHIN